jgi:hypothetical protein
MTDEEVRRVLGPPVSEGQGDPLFEEALDTMPEIGWWLNYEDPPCLQRGDSPTLPAVHLKAHVGLDTRGGRVVFIAGSSVESRGREILSQTSSASEITAQLGPARMSWSADASYHHHPGVLVRGGTGVRNYYLRDWDAVGQRLDRINRKRAEQEFARMQKPARRPGLRIPQDVLTIREVYLGMPVTDLVGLGLPYEVNPGVEPWRCYYELGDPRPSQFGQVSAACRNDVVTFLSGYQLERGGSVMLLRGDPQDRISAALGPPDSVRHRSMVPYQGTIWTYSDLSLEICVDPDGIVQQLILDRVK